MKFSNHNLHQFTVLFASIILAGLSFSCSSSLPTEVEATKALENLSHQQGNLFKVKSLAKTDGLESEANGVKQYKLTYRAEVECLKQSPRPTLFDLVSMDAVSVDCDQVGRSKKLDGAASFIKTEKGWQAIPPGMGITVAREIRE